MRLYQMEQEDRERLLMVLGFEVWRSRKASSAQVNDPEEMRNFSGDGDAIVRAQSFRVG